MRTIWRLKGRAQHYYLARSLIAPLQDFKKYITRLTNVWCKINVIGLYFSNLAVSFSLPLRKNLLGSTRKAINIYFALQVCQGGKKFATANSIFIKWVAFYFIFTKVAGWQFFESRLLNIQQPTLLCDFIHTKIVPKNLKMYSDLL